MKNHSVLLLPGSFGSAYSNVTLVRELSKRGFRIYSGEPRHRSRESAGTGIDEMMQYDYPALLKNALLDSPPDHQISIIGYSLGGNAALALSSHPRFQELAHRVSSLVLLNSGTRMTGSLHASEAIFRLIRQLPQLEFTNFETLQFLLRRGVILHPKKAIRDMFKMVFKENEVTITIDGIEALRAHYVEKPVLVIGSENDEFISTALTRSMFTSLRRSPTALYFQVTGFDHLALIIADQAQNIWDLVSNFIMDPKRLETTLGEADPQDLQHMGLARTGPNQFDLKPQRAACEALLTRDMTFQHVRR